MMRSTRTILTIFVVAVVVAAQAVPVAAQETLEEMALDILPMDVQLNVNYMAESRYLVGDPPTTARGSTEISFTVRGVYTFIRFRPGLGMDFAAIPGRLNDPQFPEITGLTVDQTHTCVDDQTMPIGRESRDLSAAAEVHPASGGIMLSRAEDAEGDRVRIGIGSWELETDFVDCPREGCFIHNFHFSGAVAEDGDQWVETEEGHLEYLGLELAVVEWSLVRSLSEGGELPLAIPVSVTRTEETVGDDETITEVFTVSGAISPIGEMSQGER